MFLAQCHAVKYRRMFRVEKENENRGSKNNDLCRKNHNRVKAIMEGERGSTVEWSGVWRGRQESNHDEK